LTNSIAVNAWAPFALGREFAKLAKTSNIVNFLDTRVWAYDWKHPAYHAAKPCWNVHREMAIQFAPGIRVNAVAPGLFFHPTGWTIPTSKAEKHHDARQIRFARRHHRGGGVLT